MSRKKSQPLQWNDILDDDGSKLGAYAVSNDWMYVRSAINGDMRETRAGPIAKSIARMMLDEPWAKAK